MKPNALVTGATGFVGSHLVTRLLDDGWKVSILVRDGCKAADLLPGLPTEAICVSDGSSASMQDTLRRSGAQVVFHLASYFVAEHREQDVEPLIESNIRFGLQLLEAMSRTGVRRLINTGTAWQHFHDEPYNPVCLYAATKQAFEDILKFYVAAGHVDVVTLKLFDTYGPADRRSKLLPMLRRAVQSGEMLRMSLGEQMLDFVYVDDVIDAYLMANKWLDGQSPDSSKTFAVSSGEIISLRDLVALFGTVAERELNVEWGARPYRQREVMHPWGEGEWVPGWEPKIPLSDGIARFLADEPH